MTPEPWYSHLLDSLLGTIVGAALVYYFGLRHLTAQRKVAFRERQLAELYAPLAGLRRQIRAKSELRLRVRIAASAAWEEICRAHPDPMPDHNERYAPFARIIDYDNEQLKAELVPKYREMLTILTERYHLSAPETRAFYQEFLEYVEVWNRWLAESVPREVMNRLEHSEDRLNPFYEHLEAQMQRLQDEIARG